MTQKISKNDWIEAGRMTPLADGGNKVHTVWVMIGTIDFSSAVKLGGDKLGIGALPEHFDQADCYVANVEYGEDKSERMIFPISNEDPARKHAAGYEDFMALAKL